MSEPRIPSDDDLDSAAKAGRESQRRQASTEHASRVDEMAENHATHPERPTQWIRPSSLDAPPPREGMTQRWIRISIRGEDDPRNVGMQRREGWVPRPVDTIPDGFMATSGSPGSQDSGYLIVDDLMLCEMPTEVYEQRKAYYAGEAAQQMAAVEQELDDQQVAGHRISRNHTSSVTYPGRRVNAAEDV